MCPKPWTWLQRARAAHDRAAVGVVADARVALDATNAPSPRYVLDDPDVVGLAAVPVEDRDVARARASRGRPTCRSRAATPRWSGRTRSPSGTRRRPGSPRRSCSRRRPGSSTRRRCCTTSRRRRRTSGRTASGSSRPGCSFTPRCLRASASAAGRVGSRAGRWPVRGIGAGERGAGARPDDAVDVEPMVGLERADRGGRGDAVDAVERARRVAELPSAAPGARGRPGRT